MLTELQGKARVHWVFELTLGSTIHLFAEEAVASKSQGVYLPFVKSMGEISVGLGLPGFGLDQPRSTVQIFDAERVLQKALGGPQAGKALDSTAKLILRSDDVALGSHYTVMDGVVKQFTMPKERTYEFVVGTDERQLQSNVKIPRLSLAHWPSIPEANRDSLGQMLFGRWLSPGVPDATGMVECTLVDTENSYWYVSYGTMDEVPQIFVDGVSDTDWTVIGSRVDGVAFLVNGKPYTIIQDTAGTKRTTANTVTCDVHGPEERGDGSATNATMTAPALMLQTIIANLVYNEWPVNASASSVGFRFFDESGSPGSGIASPVNATAITTADGFFSDLNHTASIRLDSDTKASDVIDTWAKSFRVPVAWNTDFNIAPYFLDFHPRDIYPSTFIRQDEHQVKSISMSNWGDEVRSRHAVSYILNAAAGEFGKQLIAEDAAVQKVVEEALEFTYGPAEVIS